MRLVADGEGTPGMNVIDFYLGLGSRYSYLAASQVERIEATPRLPLRLEADRQRRAAGPPRRQSVPRRRGVGQYDWAYREYDAKCWAAYYGIPFREPLPFRGGCRGARRWPAWRPTGRARWCRAAACCSG